jgi:hypothetical protein
MPKPTVFSKRTEVWNVQNPSTSDRPTAPRVSMVKIAVRDSNGRFHGATNFKQRG